MHCALQYLKVTTVQGRTLRCEESCHVKPFEPTLSCRCCCSPTSVTHDLATQRQAGWLSCTPVEACSALAGDVNQGLTCAAVRFCGGDDAMTYPLSWPSTLLLACSWNTSHSPPPCFYMRVFCSFCAVQERHVLVCEPASAVINLHLTRLLRVCACVYCGILLQCKKGMYCCVSPAFVHLFSGPSTPF